jgi:glycogen(starch) synthase
LLACLQYLRVPWVWQLGDAVPRQMCLLGEEPAPGLVAEYNRQIRGHYLACSRRLIEEIESCGLRIKDQVELLPNWVHGEPPPERTRIFDGTHLRIVTAGQVVRPKGIDILIEAAAELRKRGHENFSIDIYGRVVDQSFQAMIDRLRVQDHVTLKGVVSQEELARRFGQYDVFAFPTWRREPFGCAPLEAAAWGCVPVISEDCGIAEWLMHGVHCVKAERTVAGFTLALGDILDGRIALEPLSRRVAAMVNRDFHLRTLVPRIEQALARAACQPRTGAGTARQAFQVALLAQRNAEVLVHESLSA